jgi:hypothetical protein
MIKIHPEFYEAVRDGRKTFEVRLNDHNYQVGDTLALEEYQPVAHGLSARGRRMAVVETGYTGRRLTARVTYILNAGHIPGLGIENPAVPGWVIMSLADVREEY